MPTLTQLEYIVAVDTYRHFGSAAQKCFVTQPTLSMQIKKAEEELGTILFDRSKQPVIPTDVGVEVVKQARVVLREKERLHQVLADFQNNVSGQLRIGIIPTLAPYLLPLFVGDFVRSHPKIVLQVKELTTEQITIALQNDLLDVGILVTPLYEEQINEQPLFYEEIKLYVHPQHSFYEKSNISLDELVGQDLWLLSQGHCFRNQMINLCAINRNEKSALLPFEYEGGSLEALKRLVDREGGFTLVPELATHNLNGSVRSVASPSPLREISLVSVRNFAKTKALTLLSEQILQAVPKHMHTKNRGQIVEWK
ncbi:MAG: hydrogen peroxide-inducible genes activator [Aureispira sp.]|nr:hydrogen peroxide-inducible genes activator [Aureispira sp.]